MTYLVEIAETISQVKKVDATSPADAQKYLRALHAAGELEIHDVTDGEIKISVLGEDGKITGRNTNPAVRAVYRKGDNGFDLVAVFTNDEDLWDGDVAETYAENLRSEGEKVVVKEFDSLSQLEACLP
jgi:hypothetical protein